MIYACGKDAPDGVLVVNTTSRSKTWSKGLSPFITGPCEMYDGHVAKNMENCWQFSKVYAGHEGFDDKPNEAWWTWAKEGWADSYAHRYPAGKGAIPLYSWWDGEKLTYVEARRKIYIPMYSRAVRKTAAWKTLQELYEEMGELALWCFDGYNHRAFNRSWDEVIDDPNKKMGHSLVLAMMIDGFLKEE